MERIIALNIYYEVLTLAMWCCSDISSHEDCVQDQKSLRGSGTTKDKTGGMTCAEVHLINAKQRDTTREGEMRGKIQ